MRRTERGFTLIQLVMVVVALGVASLFVAQFVSDLVIKTKAQKTLTNIQDLRTSIYGESNLTNTTQKFFLGDVLRLPTSLFELTSDVNTDANWNGPYWTPGNSGVGDPVDQVDQDAYGRTIGWVDSSGTFTLHADTRTAIQTAMSADALAALDYMLTPVSTDMDENLYGHIIGAVRDTLGSTFPHPWHRQKVLLYLQYLGNEFIPADINLAEERTIFREHFHGSRYPRVHTVDDLEVETNNWDIDGTDTPQVRRVGKKQHITLVYNEYWTAHNHPNQCPYLEDADALADLIASFAYLPDTTTFHYNDWFDHVMADHVGVDDSTITLGNIKFDLSTYSAGYNLTNTQMQNLITVHPETDGRYYIDDVPVGNYILTAYDHYLLEPLNQTELDLLPTNLKVKYYRRDEVCKRFVTVYPNKVTEVDFRFSYYFPGHGEYDVPDTTQASLMANFLTYNATSWTINGTTWTGLTIGSSADFDLVITEVDVFWENAPPNPKAKLAEMFINGNSVWFGDRNPGFNFNINDTIIPVGTVSWSTAFSWNSDNDDGGEVQVVFEFSDASARIVYQGGALLF